MVQLAAGFIVLPILTRLLPPAEMGVVGLAVVVQLLLSIVAAAGLPSAVMRTFFIGHEGPYRARALIRRCLVIATLVALVAEVTLPIWSGIFSDLSAGTVLRIAVLSSVPLAVLTAAQSLLRAADEARRYVITALLAGPGAQGLGVIAAAGIESDPMAYIGGLVGGQTLAAVIAAVWAKTMSTGIRLPPNLTSEALRLGIPTVPHSIAIYALASGDRVVIESIEGLRVLGQYQVAYAVGSLTLLFMNAVNGAWRPIVFGERTSERWSTLVETRTIVYKVAGMSISVLVLLAPWVLALVAPAEYEPDQLVWVASIVAASAVPIVSYMASSHVIIWEARTGVMAWSTPLAAAANIGLNLTLIPLFGLEGAALSTFLAYGLLAVVTHVAARRMIDLPRGVLPLIAAFTWTAGAFAASALLPNDGLGLVARALVAGVISGWLVVFAITKVRREMTAGARQ